MSAPTSLVPGNYVIFAEDPSNTVKTGTLVNGRSNFAVTCPLSSGGNCTITTLATTSSASPTQIWLVTGDGMILSKSSSTGQLAQSPTFYMSYSNNSPNIVTTSAPASPAPTTKFVAQVSQMAASNKGDTTTYLATLMTTDLTDQFWTVDDLQNNDIVKANTARSAKNWVFVPV
ncbi:hypothetical protein JR316_0012721 [Psilocybe cubensis]|uniref:Uncharacterized protein n=1 Tax=Psilocybe cubensis TaxID=181762 RepID=A0ACB8GJC8_PSICU|nr:hypothetical protein JR316_0012721 [Psilocybe cubensis]KAH9475604.1 hypothetical protein JR316_0012721 [Psilocybe cubensis]